MRFILIFIPVFFVGWTTMVQAYYPATWEDLMYRMKKHIYWDRIKVELTVQVFEPAVSNQKTDKKNPPVEKPAKSFQQVIYAKYGQVLVVETKNFQGKLLHYYYQNQDDILSESINEDRIFETIDILPPGLRFITSSAEQRKQVLLDAGIVGRQVNYHLSDDNRVYLRIGDYDSGYYALLNPKTFQLQSLHNRIWKQDGTWWDFEIHLKKNKTYRKQQYSKITEYYLNKRLFKRTTINRVRLLDRIPVDQLKEKAKDLSRYQTATIEIDYAN